MQSGSKKSGLHAVGPVWGRAYSVREQTTSDEKDLQAQEAHRLAPGQLPAWFGYDPAQTTSAGGHGTRYGFCLSYR